MTVLHRTDLTTSQKIECAAAQRPWHDNTNMARRRR